MDRDVSGIPVAPQTSGMAITSLVLGIGSFLCWIFTGIPAIILGIIALGKINRSAGQLTGSGMAITGITTGAISSFLVLPAILAALLLPAIQAAREAARRSMSMNNMKQISLGLLSYESTHRSFPAPGGGGEGEGAQLSWRVHILPSMGEDALYKQFHLDEPWDSEHNRALISQMPAGFQNPNGDPSPGKTNYLLVRGAGTAFPKADTGPTMQDFVDGLSNTIMLIEADPDQAVEWTKPDDWQFDPNDPMRDLGNLRHYGFLAAFADGSVQFIPSDTEPEVVKAMITNNGQEQVTLP
ncbi:MAG: DUF1559 domain-containing protein [Pirellulales bacterium]